MKQDITAHTLTCMVLAFFVSLLFVLTDARAQSPENSGGADGLMQRPLLTKHADTRHLLEGTVFGLYSRSPIEGAKVVSRRSGETTFTDSSGQFKLHTSDPAGTLEIRYPSFVSMSVDYSEGVINPNKNRFSLKKKVSDIRRLKVGDSLPDRLWDMPLQVINHPDGRRQISLAEYRDKRLIVLDFWATYCSPCIRTITHWEKQLPLMGDELAYMTILVDYGDKGLPFLQSRAWKSTCIVGDDVWRLNNYFFEKVQLGGLVLLLDGKLYAIPEDKHLDIDEIRAILENEAPQHVQKGDQL